MSSPDQPNPPSGWGEAPRPPAYGQYGPGQYGGGQYGPGQYGGEQPGQGPQTPQSGHGPAPQGPYPPNPYGPAADKPGVVPLRPLSLGEIFDGAFTAVRHNPRVMLGLVTLVVAVATVLAALLAQLLVPFITPLLGTELTSDPVVAAVYGSDVGALAQILAVSLTLSLTFLVAQPFCEGLVTISVSQSVIGRRLTTGEVWQRVRARAWKLVLWMLARTAAAAVGFLVLFFGWILLVVLVAEGTGSVGATVLVAVLTGVGIVALVCWIVVRTLLVTPALVLERSGLGTTIARAWRLSRQSFWRIFGTYLLAAIIAGTAAQVVAVPLSFVGIAIDGGIPGAATVTLSIVSSVIGSVIVLVFGSGVVALIYTDVRMRREGLDVKLAEAAAREAATGPTGGAAPQPPSATGQW